MAWAAALISTTKPFSYGTIVMTCTPLAPRRLINVTKWQEFYERSCKTVGCGHMSGLVARLFSIRPNEVKRFQAIEVADT
jgi:hypothetical protein